MTQRPSNLPAGRTQTTPARSCQWQDLILYELHVRSFTAADPSVLARERGTMEGVIRKLPYLKTLGVNALLLLPVYLPMGRAANKNQWGFGEGLYETLRPTYSATDEADRSLTALVEAAHKEGFLVFLHFDFPAVVTAEVAIHALRWYRTTFAIDGVRLIGQPRVFYDIAASAELSDLFFIADAVPDAEAVHADQSPAVSHPGRFARMDGTYQSLLRRFVKGDEGVLRPFLRSALQGSAPSGRIAQITGFSGFTLADLVSYNWKHNEENGEENRDGVDNNESWNCGEEGPSRKKEVRLLRERQMRNFLLLLAMAKGAILLRAGDEVANTQGGNNNPYCLDNDTSHLSWKKTKTAVSMASFTRQVLALRASLPCLWQDRKTPVSTSRGKDLPETSLHGEDAWAPDLSPESRSIGLCLRCADALAGDTYALYLGINMHWQRKELGLPQLPAGYRWIELCDTFREDPFGEAPAAGKLQERIVVRERSVQLWVARKITEV